MKYQTETENSAAWRKDSEHGLVTEISRLLRGKISAPTRCRHWAEYVRKDVTIAGGYLGMVLSTVGLSCRNWRSCGSA